MMAIMVIMMVMQVYRQVFKKATLDQRKGLSVGHFIETDVTVIYHHHHHHHHHKKYDDYHVFTIIVKIITITILQNWYRTKLWTPTFTINNVHNHHYQDYKKHDNFPLFVKIYQSHHLQHYYQKPLCKVLGLIEGDPLNRLKWWIVENNFLFVRHSNILQIYLVQTITNILFTTQIYSV